MSALATVITPFSYASPAIELGNRTWRKKLLPVGDVAYDGRMLHFTPQYLADLASAFQASAYDQVSFQLADSRNSHTNDPERHRGVITAMDAEPDGLYITLSPTEAGEQVLRDNPMLGVSARIVEQYSRSDGQYFPAAVQHVLGTLDPRIPQLGAWQPVDMANGGQVVIDLSQASWAGEPGPAYELAVSAVASRLGSQDHSGSSAGTLDPYDDIDAILAASLPPGYGGGFPVELASDFGAAFELGSAVELARAEQDAEPLAVRSEDRLANALNRIATGTYTPQGSYAREFASPAYGSTTGTPTCGVADDLGYCQERFHTAACGSAATPDVAEALRPAMSDQALRPHLGEDGTPWLDQYGSPMTLTDHIEALAGVRLGDGSLWESHRGQRRELSSPQRPVVFGDPDDPDSAVHGTPAATARLAAAAARQAGIPTSADARQQQAAYAREHARQQARYKPPQHPDFREFANPEPRPAAGLRQFGDDPVLGALPVFTR